MSARLLPHFEGSLLVGLLVNNILNELLWWWSFGWFGGKSPWQMVFASLSLQFVVPASLLPSQKLSNFWYGTRTADPSIKTYLHYSLPEVSFFIKFCPPFSFITSLVSKFRTTVSEHLRFSSFSYFSSISWSHCSRVLIFV